MTPIDYRIGYRVKVAFEDCITRRDLASNIDWGTMIEKHMWKNHRKPKYFKGTIVDVKTHKWFGLIKLDHPEYTVQLDLPVKIDPMYVVASKVKAIVKGHELMAIYYILKLSDDLKKEPNNVATSG